MSLYVAILGIFLLAYFTSTCPTIGAFTTFYCFLAIAILVVILFLRRLQFIPINYTPRKDYTKTAVFVAGADQTVGWQTLLRFDLYEIVLFAGVEDPDSESSEWLRRHLSRRLHLVKFDPRSRDDAYAAARYVEDNLGGRELVAVIHAGCKPPKQEEKIDLDEVREGIDINALTSVNLATAFAPLMQKDKSRFVVLADMAGRVAIPSLLTYCMTQSVAIQYANVIRKMLEEYGVSTHLVEPILFNYRKTIDRRNYPLTSPVDGKVQFENKVAGVDAHLWLISQSILYAIFCEKPKERYLPSWEDFVLDTFITWAPSSVTEWALTVYINRCLPRQLRRP